MIGNANYSQMGRWSQCCWCGTIYQHGDQQWVYSDGHMISTTDERHWCNAPWQKKPEDIVDMIPGVVSCMYPESPFAILSRHESVAAVGIPCS